MPAPKIAILTSVHPPYDHRVLLKEGRTLARAGYEVVLIVPHDHDEVVEGVRLRAVPRPKGRVERMLHTTRAVLRAALEEDADAYHFHDPELIPAGLWLKAKGKRVVYDLHEDTPKDILLNKAYMPSWLPSLLSRLYSMFEALGAAWFDAIVPATEEIARRFPPEKTLVVHNYPPLEGFSGRPLPYQERPMTAVYIGSLSEPRGALDMVRAMARLPEALGACLTLGGGFVPDTLAEQLAAEPGWERVNYLGYVPSQQVGDRLHEARVGLVPLHAIPNFVDALPTKLFEYMAVGIPVIASDFPLWRAILNDGEYGLLIPPSDPGALADALRWVFEHPKEAAEMGERGRVAAQTTYNWAPEGQKLVGLYRRLLGEAAAE